MAISTLAKQIQIQIGIGITIDIAQAEVAAANRIKMESIPISIPIAVPIGASSLHGDVDFYISAILRRLALDFNMLTSAVRNTKIARPPRSRPVLPSMAECPKVRNAAAKP